MKVIDGKLKLDRRDTRVGNFVITDEKGHYKVQDINGLVAHRFRKETLIGRSVAVMLSGDSGKFLSTWIGVMSLVFSVVPDAEYLKDLYEASTACLERHRKDLYGGVETDGEDEKILTEQKNLHEDFVAAKKDGEAFTSQSSE